MKQYTIGRFRDALPPWAKVAQMLKQGEEEVKEMNFYHHVRTLKEQHAATVAAAPVTATIERPRLNLDAPIPEVGVVATAAATAAPHHWQQHASRATTNSRAAAAAARSPAPSYAAAAPEPTTHDAPVSANVSLAAAAGTTATGSSVSSASPSIAVVAPNSDTASDDHSIVQRYLFTLSPSQLDELRIAKRAVTRATVTALMRHHRLPAPTGTAKKSESSALSLLAQFLRVHTSSHK